MRHNNQISLKIFLISSALSIIGLFSAQRVQAQSAWSTSAGVGWDTSGNWASGIPTATTVAQFNANPTSATNGVGFTIGSTAQGIALTTSRSNGLLFGNSTTTGALTFTFGAGSAISSVANNIILSNLTSGISTLTLQDVQGSGNKTMTYTLGASAVTRSMLAGVGTSTTIGNTINITSTLTSTAGSTLNFYGNGTWNGTSGNCGGLLRLSGTNSIGTYVVGTPVIASPNNGILQLDATSAIANNSAITVNRYSQLYLNASSGSTYTTTSMLTLRGPGSNPASTYGQGALTYPSGNSYTWAGNLTLDSGAILNVPGTGTFSISGTITQTNTATYASTISVGGGSGTTLGGTFASSGAVSGGGTLSILGNGTYNGTSGNAPGLAKFSSNSSTTFGTVSVGSVMGTGATVNSGILELDAAGSGGTTGNITVNRYSQIYLNASSGTSYTNTNTLTLRGPGSNSSTLGTGAITFPSGNSYTWGGNLTLDSGAVVPVSSASSTLTLTGTLTTSATATYSPVFKLGAGTSTTTGGTFVANGVIAGAGTDSIISASTFNGTSGNYGGLFKIAGSNVNTFTGNIVVGRGDGTSNGILEMDNSGVSAFSTGAGVFIINPYSQLYLNGTTGTSYTSTTGSLNLYGNGPNNTLAYTGRGALFCNGKSFTLPKPINDDSAMITCVGSSSTTLTLSGGVVLNGPCIDSTSPGTSSSNGNSLKMTGIVSGSGSLTFLGGGTWNGVGSSGLVGGVLTLGNSSNSYTGAITIGNTAGTSTGILNLSASGAATTNSSSSIKINPYSQLYLGAAGTYSTGGGTLTLNGIGTNGSFGKGALVTTTGYSGTWPNPISIGSYSVINSPSSGATIGALTLSNTFSQSTNPVTFTTGPGNSNTTVGSVIVVSGLMSGSGTDTLLGGGSTSSSFCGGSLKLSNTSNTFTGGFYVGYPDGTNYGILELDDLNTIYNSSSNVITINPNSSLYLAAGTGTYNVANTTLNLNGVGNSASTTAAGALVAKLSTSYTWPGTVNIASNATINANSGTLTFSGLVSGSGKITRSGTGTLVFSGSVANTWSGGTQLGNGATITVNSSTNLGTGPVAFVQTSGATGTTTLNLNNSYNSIGTLSSTWSTVPSTTQNKIAITGTLLINQTADSTFGEANSSVTSVITGAGRVIKAGTGKLILTGTGSTFSGGLVINAGEVRFNPIAGLTTVTMNSSTDTLNGGAITTTGISTSGATITLGALDLEDNSTIDLGTSVAHTLKFSTSSGLAWTSGKILTITNWQGTYGAGTAGTVGRLFFAASTSGLGTSNLAQVQFKDASGSYYPAQQLSSGEVVPKLPTITTTTASYGPFCNTSSNVISVGYTTTGASISPYKIQLSYANGTFPSDTSTNIIGTGSSSPISATIPASDTASLYYRVRAIIGSPITLYSSNDNGSNIILNSPTSLGSITGSPAALVGATDTLSCTPPGGTWASTNTSIATIGTTSGVVTALAIGYTIISYADTFCGSTHTATDTFYVTNAPIITSVSPLSGKPGDTITITGSYFNSTPSNNTVYFGPAKATVLSGSSTSLIVKVDTSAAFGPISVMNTSASLIGYSPSFFIPTFNNSYFLKDSMNFKPAVSFSVGSNPNIAAIGDFDGDGKPDFVAANKLSDNLYIFHNTNNPGAGTISGSSFSNVLTLSTSGNIVNVKVADIDRDGKLDIICTNSTTSRIYVFRNTTTTVGTISFAAGQAFSTYVTSGSYGSGPQVLSIADVNGDGKPDIIYSAFINGASPSYDCIGILPNASSPGVALTASSFSTPVLMALPNGVYPLGICTADFDDDGKTDIAVANSATAYYYSVSVFQNIYTTGAFSSSSFSNVANLAAGATPTDVQTADIDGDGKNELLVSNYSSNTFSVFQNTSTVGSVSFGTNVDFTTGNTPVGLAAADFNGDGKVDVVVNDGGSSYNRISIYKNTATSGSITTSSFAAMVTDTCGGNGPAGVVIDDLDGDGYPDIVIGNNFSNTITIIRDYPLPYVPAISGGVQACAAGGTATLTDSLSGGFWTLSNPNANINASTGAWTGVSAGFDTAYYYLPKGGDTNYVTKQITINPLPVISSVVGDTFVCPGALDTLSDTTSYGIWGITNTVNATINSSGIVNGLLEGSDSVKFIVTNPVTSCVNTLYQKITISHYPNAGTVTNNSFCQAATSNYVSPGGDIGGVWSSNNITIATINSSTGLAGGVLAGNTTIVYTVNNGCGTAADTGTASVLPLANPGVITGVTSVCSGGGLTTLSDTISSGTWTSSNTSLATVNSSGVVTGIAIGSLLISYTVTNGCGSVSTSDTVRVGTIPSTPAAITGTTTICYNAGTTTLSDTSSGGAWSSSNTSLATVDASTGIVTGVAVGTPYITYTVSNTCGSSSVNTAVSVVTISAGITSAIVPCTGHATSIVFTGTSGATIGYQVNGGSVTNATLSGGTYTLGTGAISSPQTFTLYNITNTTCAIVIDTTTTITPQQMQWVGGTSGNPTDWNTATNWSCDAVPSASDNVIIPHTTNAPVIATSSTFSVNSLTLDSAVTVTIGTGSVLNVTGSLSATIAIVTGSGKMALTGTNPQYISGTAYINNLELNNSTGATIDTVSLVTIGTKLTMTAGTLATGDSLVLGADSVNNAAIGPIATGAAITGNVRVMTYVGGGRRAFRFWSHPFSTSIPLSQIENYIDITGIGGPINGFTHTITNNPSAFRYNTLESNSSDAYDPGWKPFTSAYGTPDSNMIHQFQGIRLFVRGSKDSGLNGLPYTILPVTIGMWGPINQGAQTVYLSKGSSTLQNYNQVGNPYPSPVDIGQVIYNSSVAGNIYGSVFYVFNPYLGSAGQYQAIPIGTGDPYYLQGSCSFQVRAAHNGDSLVFAETNKNDTVSTYLFKSAPEFTTLMIYDNNYHLWDMLYLNFNSAATDNEDSKYDGAKLQGEDLNFYSLSADSHKLSFDARPYKALTTIPLGITSSTHQDFIIKAESIGTSGIGKLYLHDKLLKQYVLLQAGTEYRFTISNDSLTQGNQRFELSTEPSATNAALAATHLEVAMMPNPATDEVKINYTNCSKQQTNVQMTDVTGTVIYKADLGLQQNGSAVISLSNIPSGIYMVELTSGNQKVIQKLVKE